MISWSSRRQLFYIGGAFAVFLFALALPTLFLVYEAPSCTDGRENQGELGVDCGGPCSLLCKADAHDIIVRWQRTFRVRDGVYNALAYVENPNLDSGIKSIAYRFKLYDKDNVLIYERNAMTAIPPKKTFGIFEGAFLTGERVPARTFFEFVGPPLWEKTEVEGPPLHTTRIELSGDVLLPRLSAILENRGLRDVVDVEVVAIVYDKNENAVGVSRTVVERVSRTGSVPLTFTWPEAFAAAGTRAELITRTIRTP